MPRDHAIRGKRRSLIQRYGALLTRRVERNEAEMALLAAKNDAEEAALKAKSAMREAQAANRAKSEFLANFSHELRTPLNAIIGFSEMMDAQALGPIENERYRDYIGDIHGSGVHLLEVINDILDISKIEAGKFEMHEEVVDLGRAIKMAVEIIRPRAEEAGLTLATELPPALPCFHADERKIKQILINLLSNAVKFTPAPGSVTLAAIRRADGGFALEVADTGIGIAAEDIAAAMAPFGQVDTGLNRKYEGTGLGLPLVKTFIELHGGTFTLESEVDVGTIATALFPKGRILGSSAELPSLGSGGPAQTVMQENNALEERP